MDCIICHDKGSEPLYDNTKCDCKYKYHTSCWIDYANSIDNLKCVCCRKDFTTKISKNVHPLPHQHPHQQSRVNYDTDSYQTLYENPSYSSPNPNLNQNPNANTNPNATAPPQENKTRVKRILQLVAGLVIITVIIVIFLIIL
jgi:hypothetical protein